MFIFRMLIKTFIAGILFTSVSWAIAADQTLKPFILAYKAKGDLASVAKEVRQKLETNGFEIAGVYSPYDTASIIIITSEELKKAAGQSKFGGYGAGQRVSITKVGDEIQVAYTNPAYMAKAYRMNDDLLKVTEQLNKALGKETEFGPKEGLTGKELHKYHYMFGMEYFDEPSILAKYDNYEQAVQAVEKGLAAGKGGVTKVYRIDIPGQQQTVFGVHMTDDCSGDKFIMDKIDFKPLRSTAHLPYEMLVAGNTVYALYARFRIAINFPDLKMMGANSFFKIMCAPGAIERALTLAAGGDTKKTPANF